MNTSIFVSTALIVLATAAAPAAGAAPEATESAAAGDLARLQGRWLAGVGPGGNIRVELDVQGERARVVIRTPQGLTIRARGRVGIDESTEPRSLDWSGFVAADGQKLPDIPAIYRFDGNNWTICNGGPNGTRPAEFRAGEGLLAGIVTFQPLSDEPANSPAP